MNEAALTPLHAIRAFETVARHRSFKLAAEELHITPSALSFQIRQLERQLGKKLFSRSSRPLGLTPAGQALLPSVIRGMDQFEEAASTMLGKNPREITIKMGQATATMWFVPRLRRYLANNPCQDIRIYNRYLNPEFNAHDWDVNMNPFRNLSDTGEHVLEPQHDSIALPLIAPSKWAELGYPRGEALLRKVRLIGDVNAHFDMPDWNMWLDAAGFAPICEDRILTCASAELSTLLAVGGGGLVLARLSLALPEIRKGNLVAPFTVAVKSGPGIFFWYHPKKLERPEVRRFVEWLRLECSETRAQMKQALAGIKIVEM